MLLSGDAPALAEAKILHPGQSGYFVLCARTSATKTGWRQTPMPMHSLESAIGAISQSPCDRYITQASYIAPSRKAINFQSIRTAFIDIDCLQKLGIQPDNQFVQRVLETTEMLGVPAPSAVIFSGRGLYCKWYFNNAVNAADMVRWKTLNSALLKMFVSLGADSKVRDLARVLRLIGSTNSKVTDGHDDVVRVAHDSGKLHDFDGLCASVATALANFHKLTNPRSNIHELIQGDVETKTNASTRAVLANMAVLTSDQTNLVGLESYADLRRPILLSDSVGAPLALAKDGGGTSAYERDVGLNWRRFIDLRNLIKLRGGAPQGTRDQFVFWMLNHLALAGVVKRENFASEARELIQLFPQHDGFDPLNEGHLNTLEQRVKLAASGSTVEFNGRILGQVYTPKTSELVDCFEITEEEQKQMCTLFLAPEKQRRRDEKNPGRADRRVAHKERVEVVRSLPDVASAIVSDVVPLSDRQIRRLRQRAATAALAHEYRITGLGISGIAEKLGLTARQVKSLLSIPVTSVAGCKKPGARRKNTKAEFAQQMRSRGIATGDIANEMGISERQVRRLLACPLPPSELPEVPPSDESKEMQDPVPSCSLNADNAGLHDAGHAPVEWRDSEAKAQGEPGALDFFWPPETHSAGLAKSIAGGISQECPERGARASPHSSLPIVPMRQKIYPMQERQILPQMCPIPPPLE